MIATFIYGTSISLPEAVAFVCGFVIIYLLFKMVGVFCFLGFSLCLSFTGSAQTLQIVNLGTAAWPFEPGASGTWFSIPQGVFNFQLNSSLITDFTYGSGYSLDLSHDWQIIGAYDAGGGGYGLSAANVSVLSFPIGTLNANSTAGLTNAFAQALGRSDVQNNLAIAVETGTYAALNNNFEGFASAADAGGVSAMMDSRTVESISNAVASAISQEEPKTDYSAALMAGMATAFTIAGFGWTYRLAKRVSYSGD